MSKKESSYGIDYERHEESDSSSFSDPFASSSQEYEDVPMSAADYGLRSPPEVDSGRLEAGSSLPSSRVNASTLSSALNSPLPDFGSARRDSPSAAASHHFASERRGVWAQASYNIGA
jgi:hypothetical protein